MTRLLLFHLFRRNDGNVSKEHIQASSTSREPCLAEAVYGGCGAGWSCLDVAFMCNHQLNYLQISAQPPNAAPALPAGALAEARQQRPEVFWLCMALGVSAPQIPLGSSSNAELCSSVMLGSKPGFLLQLLGME